MVARFAVAACVVLAIGASALAQVPQAVVSVASITRNDVKQLRRFSGTVSSYKQPATDRAPHSLLLQDSTGFIRIAIWNDVWAQISFKDKLKSPGAQVTATVEIAEFRGNLEGHLNRADDITEGLTSAAPGAAPPTGGAPRVLSADPIPWRNSVAAAMSEARQANKKILVFFENRQANVSRDIDVGVFADINVRAAVQAKFIPVKLDMTRDAAMAQKLGVFRAGVIAIYNPDGSAITHVKDVSSAEEFLRMIQQY